MNLGEGYMDISITIISFFPVALFFKIKSVGKTS